MKLKFKGLWLQPEYYFHSKTFFVVKYNYFGVVKNNKK